MFGQFSKSLRLLGKKCRKLGCLKWFLLIYQYSIYRAPYAVFMLLLLFNQPCLHVFCPFSQTASADATEKKTLYLYWIYSIFFTTYMYVGQNDKVWFLWNESFFLQYEDKKRTNVNTYNSIFLAGRCLSWISKRMYFAYGSKAYSQVGYEASNSLGTIHV